MSAAAHGFTLVLADEADDGAPATEFIVTDGGALFATVDHGASWAWFGLVDAELFLLDLGFEDIWEPCPEFLAAPAMGRRVPAA